MKLNLFETHDRYKHLLQDQSEIISKGCEDCLKRNELSLALQQKSPYIYIFAHTRTSDCGTKKRLLWQPRLTKPKAESNSMLFRAQSKTDILTICWMIPAKELWEQYKKGNVTESDISAWSIHMYMKDRKTLEAKEDGDLSDPQIKSIYKEINDSKLPKKFKMV